MITDARRESIEPATSERSTSESPTVADANHRAPSQAAPEVFSHTIAEPTASSTTTAAPPSVLSEAKKGPLYMRLFYHEPLTAVARAIGYEELSIEEWQRRLVPLIEKHGAGLIGGAVRELIEQTAGERIRLRPSVRSIAVGLLGRPKAVEWAASPSVSTKTVDPLAPTEPVPERTPRHDAIERFVEFLESRGIEHTIVDAELRRRYPQHKLSRLDLILPDGASTTLVTLQPKNSKKLRRELADWLAALGPARVIRVWPIRIGEHSQWQEETVEPLEPWDE